MQRSKGGKKNADGRGSNIDGGDSAKEIEVGGGAIKEKTKSAKNNSKRRNFYKNRQRKDSKSEKGAPENDQNDDEVNSSPSKGKFGETAVSP